MWRYAYRRALQGVLAALVFGAWSCAALSQAPDLKRADQLVKQGRAAEAFALLAPFEDSHSGNAQFDYLLGVAALDSGKADRATLALERVLAVNPNFSGARLDMARAYFQLGDIERAKREFLAVQAQQPPAVAQQVITRYLALIEQVEKAKQRTIRAYVEVSAGHDTNVNNSTNQSQIAVPALGNLVFNLNPTNVQIKDDFLTFGVGGEYARQATQFVNVFAGADMRQRFNSEQAMFDNGAGDLRLGAAFGQPSHQVRVVGNVGRYELEERLSRDVNGVGAEWRYAVTSDTQLNAFSQYSRHRFRDPAVQVNSFNQTASGIGALHVFGDGKFALFGTYLFGKERDTDGRADGSKTFDGVRLGGQASLRDNLDLFSFVSTQKGDYGRENAAFLATRSDEQTDFLLGLAWRFAPNWTLRPQYLETRNSSNIPIYAYKRAEYSVALRRDFNF